MKVIGIDQAMRHCGWQLLDVSLQLPSDQITSKLDRSNPSGYIPTHKQFKRLEGGTIKKEEKEISVLERLLDTTRQIYEIIINHKPDVLVLEGALDVGMNRSPSGLALFSLITQPWHPIGRNNSLYKAADLAVKGGRPEEPRSLDPRDKYGIYGVQLGQIIDYSPEFLISVRPERLNGMVHGKRSASGSETVARYKECTQDEKRRTNHEADAYFLAYYGTRFLMTCLTEPEKEYTWPRQILSEKEKNYFLEATKKPAKPRGKASRAVISQAEIKTGMLYQKHEAWWRNQRSRSIFSKVEQLPLSVTVSETEIPTQGG